MPSHNIGSSATKLLIGCDQFPELYVFLSQGIDLMKYIS